MVDYPSIFITAITSAGVTAIVLTSVINFIKVKHRQQIEEHAMEFKKLRLERDTEAQNAKTNGYALRDTKIKLEAATKAVESQRAIIEEQTTSTNRLVAAYDELDAKVQEHRTDKANLLGDLNRLREFRDVVLRENQTLSTKMSTMMEEAERKDETIADLKESLENAEGHEDHIAFSQALLTALGTPRTKTIPMHTTAYYELLFSESDELRMFHLEHYAAIRAALICSGKGHLVQELDRKTINAKLEK